MPKLTRHEMDKLSPMEQERLFSEHAASDEVRALDNAALAQEATAKAGKRKPTPAKRKTAKKGAK